MDFILVKVLRKNQNDNISELQRVYGNTYLLIEPTLKMSITLENGTEFWIDHIEQDLKNNRVILYDYIDICHREFWNDDFWDKHLEILYKEGWSLKENFSP